MWTPTLRQARRLVVAVVGFTLVLAGVVMVVTPGPGWITILLGLSVLAAEFIWARRLLERIKRHGAELSSKVLRKSALSSECNSDASSKSKRSAD